MMTSKSRSYYSFSFKDANFRICSGRLQHVTSEIIRQRGVLENYIQAHPEFAASFLPVTLNDGAPEVACRMAEAALRVGVGPMAAVAGAMAQIAAEAGIGAGDREIIVDNGGDIYLRLEKSMQMGLFAGEGSVANNLAFLIHPEYTPVSICSSSGIMGRSVSLGKCDLATVVAGDAALADAAATRAANLVSSDVDIETALKTVMAVDDVRGVLIVKDGKTGLAGDLPEIVRISGR